MFFIQVDDITDNKLYALAGIINSTPFAYFAKSIANPQQNGYYKFNKQFLDPVQLPVSGIPRNVIRDEPAGRCRKTHRANTHANESGSIPSIPLCPGIEGVVGRT